jgi:hypothetical protein
MASDNFTDTNEKSLSAHSSAWIEDNLISGSTGTNAGFTIWSNAAAGNCVLVTPGTGANAPSPTGASGVYFCIGVGASHYPTFKQPGLSWYEWQALNEAFGYDNQCISDGNWFNAGSGTPGSTCDWIADGAGYPALGEYDGDNASGELFLSEVYAAARYSTSTSNSSQVYLPACVLQSNNTFIRAPAVRMSSSSLGYYAAFDSQTGADYASLGIYANGVKIYSVSGISFKDSDGDAFFILNNYTVRLDAVGYNPVALTVTITDDEDTVTTFTFSHSGSGQIPSGGNPGIYCTDVWNAIEDWTDCQSAPPAPKFRRNLFLRTGSRGVV